MGEIPIGGEVFVHDFEHGPSLATLEVVDRKISPKERKLQFVFWRWQSHAKKGKEKKILAAEEVLFTEDRLSKYTVNQLQLKKVWSLEVKDGKAYFSEQAPKGIKTHRENLKGRVFVPPVLAYFLIEPKTIEQLQKNKPLVVKIADVQALQTKTFELTKYNTLIVDEKNILVVKMSDSGIQRYFNKPIYFAIDSKQRRLLEYLGAVLPTKNKSFQWGSIVYKY